MSISDLLKSADQLIALGKLPDAHDLLEQIQQKEIHKNNVESVASAWRRLGETEKALKLLKTYIETPSPNPCHIIEYCRNLQIMKVDTESLLRISAINFIRYPEAALIRAQLLASQWNYRRALPWLLKYITLEKDSYKRDIAHVNICSALIAINELKFGVKYLDSIFESFKSSNHALLCSHCLELKAQAHLILGNYAEANLFLNESEKYLTGENSKYFFYKKKWRAVIEAQTTGQLEKLRLFSEETKRKGLWELYRSTEFEIARVTRDPIQISRLYYGTPFSSFRQRVIFEFGKPNVPFSINENGKKRLEVSSGKFNGKFIFGRRDKILQIVQCLSGDQFSHLKIGAIFSKVFSGEIYESSSSQNKVHQLISRSRDFFKEHRIGMDILQKDNFYYLAVEDDLQLILSDTQLNSNRRSKLQQISDFFGEDIFTAKDVFEKFGGSRATTNRLLKKAVEEGQLKKGGQGASTIYHF